MVQVEMALTADVAVPRRGWWSSVSSRGTGSKPFFRIERIEATGAGLDEDAASAGGIEARACRSSWPATGCPEAGAKALLGMRPDGDAGLEKGSGEGSKHLAAHDQHYPALFPLAVAAMGARHVIGNCRVAAPVGRQGMARDPLTLVENLDHCLVSDAHIDEFTDEAIKGGIRMAVDQDMDSVAQRGNASSARSVWLCQQYFQLRDYRISAKRRQGWHQNRASGGR